MMSELLELLSYPFVYRALIAGALISVCASVLGVILVLKHYSLIGHGLSEVGFASLLRKRVASGCAVIMVTHDASDLEGIHADRVITISHGRIVNDDE